MNDFVVWLDSKSAHVFAFKVSGVVKSVVKKVEKEHHGENPKDQHHDEEALHYYKNLALELKGADKLLLIGPGLAKTHFQSHLQSHDMHTLASKVIGLENFESFEHKSEKQLLAAARKFYKTYNLFNA